MADSCALLLVSLWLSASPPPAYAGAYPHPVQLPSLATGPPLAPMLSPCTAGSPRATRQPARQRRRSLVSYESMQRFFYISKAPVCIAKNPMPLRSRILWPLSQALAATVSSSHIPGQASKLAGKLGGQLYGLAQVL